MILNRKTLIIIEILPEVKFTNINIELYILEFDLL